jgi:Tol biopolymer transport system component
MSIRIRSVLGMVVFVAAFVGVGEAAQAVLSGTNGRIAFSSGRGEASDATAKLYMRPTIGSIGAGTAERITGANAAGQHRHPTWSPDRTMIAYAQGDNATANYDIYVLDLTQATAIPQNITNSNAVTDDRPAWSPDGTKIAFESENADASGQINVKIYDVADETTTDFTSTAAGTYEHKPAWTPDSQTLYYTVGDPQGTNMDILRQPLAGGGPSIVLVDPTANEFQPSISPDGTKMCFTRGTGAGFNTTARVRVALANGGGQMELPGNAGIAGYNCTWSPDGTKIAYVQGTFSSGDLVMENSDLSLGLIPLESTSMRFDGNPDWAPDGNPRCEDVTVETPVNTPVEIPIPCADTGPEYEQTDVRAFVDADGKPANGTVTEDIIDLPASITYTPNDRFIGTDSFTLRSFDQVAFGDRSGVVTVNVLAPPNDFSFGLLKKNKRKGTAKLSINVPGAGEIALAQTAKLKPDTERSAGAEGVVLDLKPRGKAKRKLKRKGSAKVLAQVTFTPDNGRPNTQEKRLKLKRRRR